MRFWKLTGAGNDFVLLLERPARSLPEAARRICHRQFGIGADGLLLLRPVRRLDFRLLYYNSDGSRASFCGNGGLCSAYFWSRRTGKTALRFLADSGEVAARVNGRRARISVPAPTEVRMSRRIRARGRRWRVDFCRAGVPHACLFVKNLERADVRRIGRAIRFHPAFGREGTNVNFVEVLGRRRIATRTYERGVEDETLSCGSGAIAAAVLAFLRGKVRPPVRVSQPGGERVVDFRMRNGRLYDVSLEGEVRIVCEGQTRRI